VQRATLPKGERFASFLLPLPISLPTPYQEHIAEDGEGRDRGESGFEKLTVLRSDSQTAASQAPLKEEVVGLCEPEDSHP
jgi:hypothetical protein